MSSLPDLLQQIQNLRKSLHASMTHNIIDGQEDRMIKRFVSESGLLVKELQRVREQVSPVRFGSIGITLGRSDSIAKFFAFSFTNQDKRHLAELVDSPFYGAGVYAIYYHGKTVTASFHFQVLKRRYT